MVTDTCHPSTHKCTKFRGLQKKGNDPLSQVLEGVHRLWKEGTVEKNYGLHAEESADTKADAGGQAILKAMLTGECRHEVGEMVALDRQAMDMNLMSQRSQCALHIPQEHRGSLSSQRGQLQTKYFKRFCDKYSERKLLKMGFIF